MAKKTIFIGSATEALEVAKKVAQTLGDHAYDPVRWWSAFRAGTITIDVLTNLAQSVDGAIFLFTGHDKTWYRNTEVMTPRDNVILEYGLFVGHLGRERVLILKDKEAKLASDITAVTFERIGDDVEAVPERALEHFDRIFARTPDSLDFIPVIADPTIVDRFLRPLPQQRQFRLRDLYVGIQGAKAWIELTSNAGYPSPGHDQDLLDATIEMIDKLDIRTLISMGPGSAEKDEKLATNLRTREPWLEYIAIDISDCLLQNAMLRLKSSARIRTGILGDFEDNIDFIAKQINRLGRHPALFYLSGGTLGNIDGSERDFLTRIRMMMTNEDYFLFDVSTAGPKWEREKDPRLAHDGYPPSYRRFFARGISLKTGKPVDEIANQFEQRFHFQRGRSNVEGTQPIDIIETNTGNKLAIIRRYNFEKMLKWLSARRFKVVDSKVLYEDGEVLGDAIFLLKRVER